MIDFSPWQLPDEFRDRFPFPATSCEWLCAALLIVVAALQASHTWRASMDMHKCCEGIRTGLQDQID
jgi:hypothetical protein